MGNFFSFTMSLLEALERKNTASRYRGTVGIMGKKRPKVPRAKKERPKSL